MGLASSFGQDGLEEILNYMLYTESLVSMMGGSTSPCQDHARTADTASPHHIYPPLRMVYVAVIRGQLVWALSVGQWVLEGLGMLNIGSH
jgi:hypothetical protein